MADDIVVSQRIDKFLAEFSLSDAEKLTLRTRLAAASAADVAVNAAAIDVLETTVGAQGGAIDALEATVGGHTVDIAALTVATDDNTALIAAGAYRTYVDTTLDNPILSELVWLEAFIEGNVVSGVSSVAGLSGAIGSGNLRVAINVANGADVTNSTTVAAAVNAATEKILPANADRIPALDSAAGNALKWFSIANLIASFQTAFNAVYATLAQGAKADTAVQPNANVTLGRLQLAPVALAALPTAASVGAGVTANINDGSAPTFGAVALNVGVLTQRVRSDGTYWRVDSTLIPMVTDHGLLTGLADDDHAQYPLVAGTRAVTGMQEFRGINFTAPTILTLASDACVATRTLHFIAAQTGVADNLSTITAAKGVGDFLVIAADVGDTITLKHGTGNLRMFDGADTTITSTSPAILVRMGANWLCVKNYASAGGGSDWNSTIVDFFGGTSTKLDSLNSADFVSGALIMFRDASEYIWHYRLKAGNIPGELPTLTVDTVADTITSAGLSSGIVGDVVVFGSTDTLPAPLVRFTNYLIKTKPTATSATLHTGNGVTIDLTTTGTGVHFGALSQAPYRILPADYDPAAQAFYWERVIAKWEQFALSFMAFVGTVTASTVRLARHTFEFEIMQWGLSVVTPIGTPGSGSSVSLTAQLWNTANNGTAPLALLDTITLGVGAYSVSKVIDTASLEATTQIQSGQALLLTVTVAGNTAPVGLEVHLWGRRAAVTY